VLSRSQCLIRVALVQHSRQEKEAKHSTLLHVPLQVQDKALDVLSQHLLDDVKALQANVKLIQHASEHQATSVRKRAVEILWSSYINSDVYTADAEGPERIAALLVHSLRLFSGALQAAGVCNASQFAALGGVAALYAFTPCHRANFCHTSPSLHTPLRTPMQIRI
jgi:hypothetical protein